jgi:hypothetical protein
MELVGVGFVGEGVDETFAGGDFEVAEVFDGELGHGAMVANAGERYRVEFETGLDDFSFQGRDDAVDSIGDCSGVDVGDARAGGTGGGLGND